MTIRSIVMKKLRVYWGYILFVLMIVGLATGGLGPMTLLVASAACGFYFLLQVPVWCGAENRGEGYCRHNARGLLMGCNQVRQHKWQHLKLLVRVRRWGELGRSMLRGWESRAASISALGTILAAAFAGITLLVT